MLLVIDVGNTNIVLGVYEGYSLICDFRLNTIKNKTSDEYAMSITEILHANDIKKSEIDDVVVASVVPDVMHSIENAIEKYFNLKPIIIDDNCDLGIKINHDNPKTIGADRIVNSVAGIKKYGVPLIIIDIGTAITFDVVDENSIYQGGAIIPGIGISSEALFLKTAKLPRVELYKPERIVAKNTMDNIRVGMVIGYIGLIEKLIDEIVKEMKFEGDRLSLVDTEGEKIEATLKQFNKALQNIWRNFTMEELSGAFRSAPDTVLEEITKEKMPKTVTIKNFGKFTNKEELNIYKLVKEGIEYYFNAENKEELKKVKNIFSNIELTDFIKKAKEYSAYKLLELKNDSWLEEDEKEVTEKEFKERIKFAGLHIFSESANFYFDDDDLFWGHTIEVTVNQKLEFTNADIAG